MTGLTLVHHEWHPKQGAEHYVDGWGVWRWREADLDHTMTPHVVPDGKWIIERPLMWWSWLVGAVFADTTTLDITDSNGVNHRYIICDKPFGYVMVENDDDVDLSKAPREPLPNAHRMFICARQVHKGELSRGVPLRKEIGYVRARDKKRGNGWVCLSDLSRAADLDAEDLIFGYWQFSGHRNYRWYENDQDGGQLVDVVIAWTADDIEHKTPQVQSFTREQMRKHLFWSTDQNVWVRRGFAFTILRLLALGYMPAMQSA